MSLERLKYRVGVIIRARSILHTYTRPNILTAISYILKRDQEINTF